MSDTSDVRMPGIGRFRRVGAALVSLLVPGAGHCVVGAFRRGVVWAVGLPILQILLLYAVPVAATIWSQLLVTIAGRAAAALDTVWTVRQKPAWGRVAATGAVVIVGTLLTNLAVVRPLAAYYRQHYAQALVIPTGGMEPTLLVGDSIMVDRAAYRDRAPQRHDIVVFEHPEAEQRDFVKRVVGLPGDVIVVRREQVFVNGQLLGEPYLDPQLAALTSSPVTCGSVCEPTTVPIDSYFLLGDNRNNSEDSRFFGFVKRASIKGRAHSIYWSWDMGEQRIRTDRIGRVR